MRLLKLCLDLMIIISHFPFGTSGACNVRPRVYIYPKDTFRYEGEALNTSCKVVAPPGQTLGNGELQLITFSDKTTPIECPSEISFRNSSYIAIKSTTNVYIPKQRDVLEVLYSCVFLFDSECRQEDHTIVEVDKYPKSVDHVSCIIYNSESITCVLDLGQFYRHRLGTKPNSTIRIDVDIRKEATPGQLVQSEWMRCPEITFVNETVGDSVTCSWNSRDTGSLTPGVYEVQVNITNRIRHDSVKSSLRTTVSGLSKPDQVTVNAINSTVVLVSWHHNNISDVTDYIVHWCESAGNHICASALKNQTISPDEREWNVHLPGLYEDFFIGVSTEYQTRQGLVSSGISWSTCTQLKYGLPNIPMNISVKYTDNGILLLWTQYQRCNPEYGVADIAKLTIQNLDQGNKTVINVTMSSESYLVTDLSPGHYVWWIQGIFPGGLSTHFQKAFVINEKPNFWKEILIPSVIILVVVSVVILVVICRRMRKRSDMETSHTRIPVAPAPDSEDSDVGISGNSLHRETIALLPVATTRDPPSPGLASS